MGKILVWVQMLVREGNTWRTHAESEPVEVEVVAPRFALQFMPASGEAYIGDEVRVRIDSQPGVAAALIDYRWLEPRFGNRREYGNNASEIGFIAQDDQPLALEVHARVPFYGDEIAILTGSYSGRGYEVSIPEPRRPGPPAQIWDAVAGGLVDAPSGVLVVHQEIYLEARMEPRIPDGVRYRWRVTSDGARVFSPGGRETRFSAHEPGTYTVALAVHDNEGRLLGSSSRDLSVMADGIPAGQGRRPPGDDEAPPGDPASPPPGEAGAPPDDQGTPPEDNGVPPDDDDPPPPDQNDARARQLYRSAQDAWSAGDITTAVSLAAEAAQLAPGLADIVAGAADLAERAQRIAGHIDAMRDQARVGELDEAIRSVQAALDINPAYAEAQRNMQRLRYLKEKVDHDRLRQPAG